MNQTVRDAVVGAWELVSFVARDTATGEGRCTLCAAPRGLILYTDDGHMSAQLAESGTAGYVAYGGRFSVDEATSTVTDDAGATTHNTLVWRLPSSSSIPATCDGRFDSLVVHQGDTPDHPDAGAGGRR